MVVAADVVSLSRGGARGCVPDKIDDSLRFSGTALENGRGLG